MIKKYLPKLLLSLAAFLLSVLLLECGLRSAGWLWGRYHVPEQRGARDGAVEIVCAGDSFTVGGRGMTKDNYPFQLQGMIDRDGAAADVVNLAMCEHNSRRTLRLLEGALSGDAPRPDCLLLLTGAANRFNPAGYGGGMPSFIEDARVVKMVRILGTNIRARWLRFRAGRAPSEREAAAPGRDPVSREDIEAAIARVRAELRSAPSAPLLYIRLGDLYRDAGKLSEAKAAYREAFRHEPHGTEALRALFGLAMDTKEFDEADRVAGEMLARDPGAGRYQQMFARLARKDNAGALRVYEQARREGHLDSRFDMTAGVSLLRNGVYAPAVAHLLRVLESYRDAPEDAWGPGEIDRLGSLMFYLAQAWSLQNTYPAEDVLAALRRVRDAQRDPEAVRAFEGYIRSFADRRRWEARMEGWIRQDLEDIGRLCAGRGVRLVVQNYPYPYVRVNRLLKELADRRGLPFVDHQSVFDALVTRDGREPYFLDDDHMTDLGHRIMAENVYRVLAREKIIQRREVYDAKVAPEAEL